MYIAHGPLSRAEQAFAVRLRQATNHEPLQLCTGACEHGLRGALPPAAQARTGRSATEPPRGGAVQLQAFEDEVIDRLFVLNELRAKKEAALGKGAKKGSKKKTKKAVKSATKSTAGKKKTASKSKDSDQWSLF